MTLKTLRTEVNSSWINPERGTEYCSKPVLFVDVGAAKPLPVDLSQ